jgi:glutamate carboxypeptidase
MDLLSYRDYFKNHQEAFKNLLRHLASLPTYSGSVPDILCFQDILIQLFEPFDPHVTRVQTEKGDVLSLHFLPSTKEKIVLLAHVDTVRVSANPSPIRIENDRMYGNGVYDMKAGIALFFYVRKAIQELNLSPSHGMKIIFTPDEETGSVCSMPLLLEECKDAAAVLIPEPCCPDGGVKIRRKGVLSFEAQMKGEAAHSGLEPEKGKDANRGLFLLIDEIDRRMKKYPDVTFNPGIISGGVRINVISPESILKGEFRSHTNSILKEIAKEIMQINKVDTIDVSISANMYHPALEFDGKNQKLFRKAKNIAAQLHSNLTGCSTGGASDGSTLSSKGIPVLDGIGIQGGGAHSPDEFIELSDFAFRAALLTGLSLEI